MVYIATGFLLSVIVCAFFISCTVGTGYGANTRANNKLVPYRSLFGINKYEAAGPTSSSTTVHSIHYGKKTSWWGVGGVPPPKKLKEK